MYVFTWNFWKDTAARMIRTFCQTLSSVLGGSAFSIWSVGWASSLGIALGASFVSFLMSVDRAFAITEVKVIEPDQSKELKEATPL